MTGARGGRAAGTAPLLGLLLLLAAGCAGGAANGEGADVLDLEPSPRLEENLVTLRQVYERVRFDGEYGLMVRDSADALRVHWITRQPGPGFLRVRSPDSLLHDVRTPPLLAHGATFPRPEEGRVRLEYGALEDEEDRHATTLYLDGPPRRDDVYRGVDSVFAVGDVHGEYENLVDLLYNAGLLDEDLRWAGGGAHVVFLGDLFDRGDNVLKTLWFLYGLERQALAAGGRLHVLLGNHETMVLTGDLRYVSAKEQMIPEFYGTSYPALFDVRATVLGRWLAGLQGMVKIDGYVFAHGGPSPAYADYSIGEFNDSLSAFMGEELFHRWADSTYQPVLDSAALARRFDFFFGGESVFWYRDYVTDVRSGPTLEGILERHGARALVVGHTPVKPIQSRMGGRLIAVDLSDPATEMLFLKRTDGGVRRLRFQLRGPPEPLPEGPLRPTRPGRTPSPTPAGARAPSPGTG